MVPSSRSRACRDTACGDIGFSGNGACPHWSTGASNGSLTARSSTENDSRHTWLDWLVGDMALSGPRHCRVLIS
jgi:hypothetical protein